MSYISREAVIDVLKKWADGYKYIEIPTEYVVKELEQLPSADVVEVIRCEECKHFEHDKKYIIQGLPLLGHEVCSAWGDGCKTDEIGWCFLAERRTE